MHALHYWLLVECRVLALYAFTQRSPKNRHADYGLSGAGRSERYNMRLSWFRVALAERCVWKSEAIHAEFLCPTSDTCTVHS
jgi:hypothetical protein